ncbi:hypothetical protein L226DRAFT_559309 [Lentinus tigrinus ALCF2SS1-7]|uniref:Uncharacterized protein n=1 Tax=Lentinus tigrinus ALCF2SS1-6 TaxID=1328759 RepID=A0A5C2SJM1_9APHY|nr:hypothetical protein L227DRAFT_521459 [Lentinus tigrinus ALCF2SS1-6]RPD77232.1 hypothetical protein L226DRAFT_559309 [Lentinus tigrinus ALCF2SS1-7]
MSRYTSIVFFLALLSLWSSSILSVVASPFLPLPTQFRYLNDFAPVSPRGDSEVGLASRTDGEPQFPDQPPSCPICAQNFDSIDGCAQAAPVLQNFSMIIFNPGAFIDVIKCACTDTFLSAYPQCVDCFIQTNQTQFLNSSDLPAVVDGMRKICALESTLLGGVATADGEVTPTSSLAAATPTSSNAAVPLSSSWNVFVLAMLLGVVATLL